MPPLQPVKDQMVMVPGDRPYILIVPMDDGSVTVRGPLNNPPFAFGLLEMARVQIIKRVFEHYEIGGGGIVLPGGPVGPGMPPGDGRGG